jgi:hypothetical protein
MWARSALLVGLVGPVPMEGVLAQGPVVSYPREYQTSLVKYAVVDRVDGLSRDLYASRDAIEALTHDPGLELPVGTRLAIDVYRAKVLGRDPKSGATIFATDPGKHLSLLKRFTTSGTVQYSYCPQPGRQICPF